MNPPYFKLRKDPEAARVMAHAVHGRPNAYVLLPAADDSGRLTGETPHVAGGYR